MKILEYSTYIYDNNHIECSKKNTGLGHMVNDIIHALSEYDQVYVLTDAFTNGFRDEDYVFLSHNYKDIIKNLKLHNIILAICTMYKYNLSFGNRVREAFSYINKGYIKRKIKLLNPDIVHIHGVISRNIPIIDVCIELNIPFTLTLHGVIGDSSTSENNKLSEEKILKKLDDLMIPFSVVSTGVKDRVVEKYKLKNIDNIIVILNGTNKIKYQNNCNVVKKNKYNIICVGNISVNKNQVEVIDAFELLPMKIQENINIHFFGKILDDSRFLNKIKKHPCNLFYYGSVDRVELEKYWNVVDLNILASYDEGFGLSIIEGYLHGVPSIYFANIDAAQDLYSCSATIIPKSRSANDLAEAIIEAYNRKWNKQLIFNHSKKYLMSNIGYQYHCFFKRIVEKKNENIY